MRLVGRRIQHPVERALRIVEAAADLLDHHFTFGIELPEHRIRDAVALHPHEQLEPVGREIDVELHPVRSGRRGEARAAGEHVDPHEVRAEREVAILLRDELLIFRVQLFELRRGPVGFEFLEQVALPHVVADAVLLVGDLARDRLDARRQRLFLFPAAGADDVRAFEEIVLEQVRQAVGAGLLAGDVGLIEDARGDASRRRPLNHEHRHAVGEAVFLHIELERRKRDAALAVRHGRRADDEQRRDEKRQ